MGAAQLWALQPRGNQCPHSHCICLLFSRGLEPSLLAVTTPHGCSCQVLMADVPFPCRAEVVLGNIIKKKGWR